MPRLHGGALICGKIGRHRSATRRHQLPDVGRYLCRSDCVDPGDCNKKISDGRWVHVACLAVQQALAATFRPVDWNWGAFPMGGSLNKRSPANAHKRWCNVDSTTILNWLSIDQCLFACHELSPAMVQCAQEIREQGQFLSAIAEKSHWARRVIGATDVQVGGVLVCGSLG